MDLRLRTALAVWIALVWSAMLLVGAVSGDWLGAQIASPVMIFVGGYYFGSEVVSRFRGTNGRRDSETKKEDDRWSHMP